MAINQTSSNNNGDEDYIDMEVCYSISSPPQSREFEFQMCSVSSTYPADELFYKGKLLPLHIPHRVQMVQKLTQGCNNNPTVEENSPSESCRVSSELNPDDYFFECSNEMNRFIDDHGPVSRTTWTRKLKQIKQSLISQKLKASRAYLKSLFSKSGCSVESCGKAASACNVDESGNVSILSKNGYCVNKYMKMAKKNPFGKIDNDRYKLSSIIMKSIDKEIVEDAANSHRRSFSGVIQRHSTTKSSSTSTSTSTSSSHSSSSSSSFLFGSSGFYDLQSLKRSNSANSEIESSIEGAIAHCKQSQQVSSSKKTSNELGISSLFASKISISGDQEKPGLCSI